MSGNTGITKAISFSVVLIGIAVFYYFVIFLPKQERAKLDFEKQQEQQKMDLQKQQQQAADEKSQENGKILQSCLDEAAKNYYANFENNCQKRGLSSDCNLPLELANSIREGWNEAKDVCFKMYPQK
jgi:hypothetical protein